MYNHFDIFFLGALGFCIILVIICIKKPSSVLLALVFLNIVWPNYIVFKTGVLPGLTPPRILTVLLIFTLLMTLALSKFYRVKVVKIVQQNIYIFVVIAVYFFVLLISSILNSSNLLKSVFAIANDFIMGPVLLILILLILDNKIRQNQLFIVLILAFLLANIVGIFEWLKQGAIFADYLITETNYTILKEKVRSGQYRLMSVFANSLVFSQVLVLSIPLYIYAIVNSGRLTGLFWSLNLILTLFLIYKTGSRAAIYLVFIFPVYYLYSLYYFRVSARTTKYLLIIIPSILFIVIALYAANNTDNVVKLSAGETKESEWSTMGRVNQLEIGITALMEKPLLGYGAGCGVGLMYPRTSIDNLYLTIALDSGLLGLFLFLFLNFLVLKKSLQRRNVGQKEMYIYLSIGLILGFFLILSIDTVIMIYYILVAMLILSTQGPAPAKNSIT